MANALHKIEIVFVVSLPSSNNDAIIIKDGSFQFR